MSNPQAPGGAMSKPIVWLVVDERKGRMISHHYSEADALASEAMRDPGWDGAAVVSLSMDDMAKLPSFPPEGDRQHPQDVIVDSIRKVILITASLKYAMETPDERGPTDKMMARLDREMVEADKAITEAFRAQECAQPSKNGNMLAVRTALLELAAYIDRSLASALPI